MKMAGWIALSLTVLTGLALVIPAAAQPQLPGQPPTDLDYGLAPRAATPAVIVAVVLIGLAIIVALVLRRKSPGFEE